MSRVTLTGLAATAGGAIAVATGVPLYSSGMVVQTQYVRTNNRTQYSLPGTGDGTTITDLNITVTPKFSTSLLIMQWMVNCEISVAAWDTVFLIHRNNLLVTQAGYQGFNNIVGNQRWSGIAPGMYDNNNDSTMANYFLQYAIPAGSTSSQTFAPAARSSNASARVLFLNRTITSTGQDSYEVAVSSGVLWEVAQ